MKMDTKKTARYYDIMNGPGKEVLFDACKYAHAEGARVPVNFSVAASYTAATHNRAYMPMELTDVVIYGINHEDDSGESFNLHGQCYAVLDTSVPGTYTPCHFHSFYNSKTRRGEICFYDFE